MAQFTYDKFINCNTAPAGADHISVYDSDGNIVGIIPLGALQSQSGDTLLYKFGLLSDIHVDTTDYNYQQYISTYPYSDEGQGDFQRALKWLTDNENVDMICACGDMSQNGTASEFAMPQSVIANYLPTSKGVPFYTCTGNHDVKTAGGAGFGNYFLRSFEQSWTGMTGFERSLAFNESFCFSKAAGDKTDHFIFFSMYSYSLGPSASPYLDDDITWLRGKLNQWKNDRVFLFTHLFFPDYAGNLGRVNGQGGIYPTGNWLGGNQLTTLLGMLSFYKNVIWFSGHSHWKWDLQKYQTNINVQQYGDDGAWTVHVPSCALPIDSDYTNIGQQTSTNRVEKPLESQGGVVYVYADRIEIRGIDFNINASQKGDTTHSYSGDTYTRYLPIAHYNMSTVLKTIGEPTQPGDPVQGYYVVTSNGKHVGETIEKEGDYIIIKYTDLSQCVAITNGQLTQDDSGNTATITAEDVKVIFNNAEIDLANVNNFGIYLGGDSAQGGGTYANLATLKTTEGVTNANIELFTFVDSNGANSTTGYTAQLNVSSRFLTGNDWINAINDDNPVYLKIKKLRINGVLVNTQEGDIRPTTGETSGITYEMVNVPYAEINSMVVGSSKEVIMVNPHKNNGYVLGYNGSAAVSHGNGLATEQDMKNTCGEVANSSDNYHMVISKLQDMAESAFTEDVQRTFAVNGQFNNTNLTKLSTSISGYDAYGVSNTSLSNSTRTANTTITFDGAVFPRTVYAYLRKSRNSATATARITSGGSGNLSAVVSTSTNIPTSLSSYTAITMTASTLVISTSVRRGSNGDSAAWVILVPNNVTEQEQHTILVPTGDEYYTLTSKVGDMSPIGTNGNVTWGSTPIKYNIENATSLGSSSDLTSGVSPTNNPNLIRFKNPSNNYLNAGGGLSSLKFASGTGEWSVWYLYDANNASSSADYLQKTNFESNAQKKGPSVDEYVQNLGGGYVAVSFDDTSQGFWITPSNYVQGLQPTLVVDDVKVYSGKMVTTGTTIAMPQNVGFYEGTNHSGTDRYQIANGFQPSISESGANGRMQLQTSSSYTAGEITIVMKAKFTY